MIFTMSLDTMQKPLILCCFMLRIKSCKKAKSFSTCSAIHAYLFHVICLVREHQKDFRCSLSSYCVSNHTAKRSLLSFQLKWENMFSDTQFFKKLWNRGGFCFRSAFPKGWSFREQSCSEGRTVGKVEPEHWYFCVCVIAGHII